ncbi:uncharacterized protein UTRI_10474_B [Ustilago trichophora]|uniref:Uncharacterized protein n=1 Tax=Ustilago trichophora TaxID=86804 RepID=A0A5C3E8X9_9BASI|nr:uncharacterized protein UTRI_10474_B [Ustilago trichophora]
MSTTLSGVPAPPPLPITRSNQPPPTQVEFLLSQVRATLRYLSEIGSFDPAVYRQIHELLVKGTIDTNPTTTPPPSSSGATERTAESDPEEIGKKNAWLRKALSETSILPTTVETALSLTAGPLLSSDQKDAIVQLVEFSQRGVANKLTDPTLQKRTVSGAKTAQSSTVKTLSGWGKGLKEGKERKKSGSDEKKKRKKEEKAEKKLIKEELKRERNEVIRLRQQQMLRGDSAGSAGLVTSPTSTGSLAGGSSRADSLSMDRTLSSLRADTDEDTSSSSEDESDGEHSGVRMTNHGPINVNSRQTGSNSIADTATLTVLSDPITDTHAESKSSLGGTNTTFIVEPGLAISCSLVVVKGGKELGDKLQLAKEQNARTQISLHNSAMGASPSSPPPPPSHPEVIATRRQSSGAAPPLVGLDAARGVAQPPIPPRPYLSRPN